MSISIIPIPAFNDNYIWLYQNSLTQTCFVVDPGDANPVLDYLEKQTLKLSYILITHHHFDHTGGVEKLVNETQAIVYAPSHSPFKRSDYALKENDLLELEAVNCQFKILEIPGHTLDHIAYYNDAILFCGDTLFSGGCGRLFEGSAEQMHSSLEKLKALPDKTQVYCGHEYTQANLKFAKVVEPNNLELKNYTNKVAELRAKTLPTLPSSIALEKNINPFLRTQESDLIKNAERILGRTLNNPVDVFAAIRAWKDRF